MILVVSDGSELAAGFHPDDSAAIMMMPDAMAREHVAPAVVPPSGDTASVAGIKDQSDALLAALTQMAALSMRRQADVAVAMRRSSLTFSDEALAAALAQLLRDACIEPPLALSDGGILVAVTVRGIEYLATTAHRHVAVILMSRGLV